MINFNVFKMSKPATPSMEPTRRRISMEAWSEPKPKKKVKAEG